MGIYSLIVNVHMLTCLTTLQPRGKEVHVHTLHTNMFFFIYFEILHLCDLVHTDTCMHTCFGPQQNSIDRFMLQICGKMTNTHLSEWPAHSLMGTNCFLQARTLHSFTAVDSSSSFGLWSRLAQSSWIRHPSPWKVTARTNP